MPLQAGPSRKIQGVRASSNEIPSLPPVELDYSRPASHRLVGEASTLDLLGLVYFSQASREIK